MAGAGDGGGEGAANGEVLRDYGREVAAERERVRGLGAELRRALDAVEGAQTAFEGAVHRLCRTENAWVRAGGGDSQVGRGRWTELMPESGGWFVELFLGTINVRMGTKRERLRLKEEYELLKQKLAPVFVVMCIVCLIFEENRWLHMLLQLGLSTYYVSLALRENILRANGSNIKSWWIIHHYLTMCQGVVLLTWPSGASYAKWRTPLHYFGLYNALLQIFQTRYQIARLYTLRSLGKAGEMDVANSDSTQFHWSESMKFLLPLIGLGQIMQAWQAVSLLLLYREYPLELQILLLGLLFCATFTGNFITTAVVVLEKRKGQRKPPQTEKSRIEAGQRRHHEGTKSE